MNEVKRSVFSAGMLILAISAVVAGNVFRSSRDLGQSTPSLGQISSLVASKADSQDVPETSYYNEIVDLLKANYVEPIDDEQVLLNGAVRGMISLLGDANSLYFDKNQFTAFNNAMRGKYEGVGVQLIFEYPAANGTKKERLGPYNIPIIKVAEVAPGGSAAIAGVRVGDTVEEIDHHWVINGADLKRFGEEQKKLASAATGTKALLDLRRELRAKSVSSLMPFKATDKLVLGSSGSVTVSFRRGDQNYEKTLQKGKWNQALFVPSQGSIAVRFYPGCVSEFVKAGKEHPGVPIDLRNNAWGDYDAMMECLQAVAPAGVYGSMMTEKKVKPLEVRTSSGTTNPLPTVLVDKSTRGVAEIFALALQSRGAKVDGVTQGDPVAVAVTTLADGSGYCLAMGKFRVGGAK